MESNALPTWPANALHIAALSEKQWGEQQVYIICFQCSQPRGSEDCNHPMWLFIFFNGLLIGFCHALSNRYHITSSGYGANTKDIPLHNMTWWIVKLLIIVFWQYMVSCLLKLSFHLHGFNLAKIIIRIFALVLYFIFSLSCCNQAHWEY